MYLYRSILRSARGGEEIARNLILNEPRQGRGHDVVSSSLNIAISISGFFRGCAAEALSSLKVNIIEPNQRAGHNVQLYGVTWDIDGTRQRRTSVHPDPRYDETEFWTGQETSLSREKVNATHIHATAFGNTGIALKVLLVKDFDSYTKALIIKPRNYTRGKTTHQVYAKHCMWYQIKESLDQALANGRVDIVFRTRWDVVLRKKVEFAAVPDACPLVQIGSRKPTSTCTYHGHSTNILVFDDVASKSLSIHKNRLNMIANLTNASYTRHSLFLPMRTDITDDMFAFGNSETMRIYSAVYSNLDSVMDQLWGESQPIQSEDILLKFIASKRVFIVPYEISHSKCNK